MTAPECVNPAWDTPSLLTTEAALCSNALPISEGDIEVPITLRRALNALLVPVLLAALVACGGGGDEAVTSAGGSGGGAGGSGGGSGGSGAGGTGGGSGSSGGGATGASPLSVALDSFTLRAGQTAQLLSNDRLSGAVPTAGAGGSVSFSLVSGTLPAGVDVTNGLVSVSAAAVPGVVPLTYRLCESANTSNCANADAVITVPPTPILALGDSFNFASSGAGDLLANDTLGGVAATSATVRTQATTAVPTGATLSAAGLLSIDATAQPGDFSFAYRICEAAALTNCAYASARFSVVGVGSVTGRTVDSATGQAISGVTVTLGSAVTTSDSTGAFSFAGLTPASRATVRFTVDSHAQALRVIALRGGATTDVQARLVSLAATGNPSASNGGTVRVTGSPAQVTLPANALQAADGSLAVDPVRVRITPVNAATDTSVLSGDFSSLVSGLAAPIETFGAAELQFSDGAGAALSLRSGVVATVRFAVGTRSASPPASAALYVLDTSTGRWVQDGSAVLAGVAPNRYYEGTISRAGLWAVGAALDAVLINGCVSDSLGSRVANARVVSDGIDYTSATAAATDASGNFRIALRRSASATLVAEAGGPLSNTLRVGPFATDSSVASCLVLSQAGAGVTMKLTWGEFPRDLDSHILTPSGTHVYYAARGSLTAAPFAGLDVDDVTSFGPEVLTLTRLMVGTYKYYIVNFSGYGAGPIAAASARVELNIPGRAPELYTPPAAGELSSTRSWLLFELDVDATCTVTVRRQGTYIDGEPSAVAGTPVYCSR